MSWEIRFSEKQASKAFIEIGDRFYNHNFGQMSKSDFEVLLFKLYQENLQYNHMTTDDFSMATALGIPESKVRNLKVKVELQYPDSGIRWQEKFLQSVQYATCEDGKTVKVSIKDPNVKRNLEHVIDEQQLYSEIQLNPKLLQMRADHFITLCTVISEQLGNNAIDEKALKKQLLESSESKALKEAGIFERIRNGESIRSLRGEIIAAAGKVGIEILLKNIPFGKTMESYVEAFLSKL